MNDTISKLKAELAELEPKASNLWKAIQISQQERDDKAAELDKGIEAFRDQWHPIYVRCEEIRATIKTLERLAQPDK